MMPRADWLSAADLCSIPQAHSLRAELNAQSALLPVIPDTAGRRFSPHTLTCLHIHTLVCAHRVCAHHRLLQLSDFTWASKAGGQNH